MTDLELLAKLTAHVREYCDRPMTPADNGDLVGLLLGWVISFARAHDIPAERVLTLVSLGLNLSEKGGTLDAYWNRGGTA